MFRKLILTYCVTVAALIGAATSVSAQEKPNNIDDQTITDAYVYLLGRAIVIRQEHIDLQVEGIDYNVIRYNPLGTASIVNPNLDVAYLEAWIAVDDKTAVLLEVPEVEGRYYTAQILDEPPDVRRVISRKSWTVTRRSRWRITWGMRRSPSAKVSPSAPPLAFIGLLIL